MAKKKRGQSGHTPAPKAGFWQGLRARIASNWQQVVVAGGSWVVGQLLPVLDQTFSTVLPIPGELRLVANCWTAFLVFTAVVISAVAIAATTHFILGHFRRALFIVYFLAWFFLAMHFYSLFFVTEAKWKEPGTDFDLYYNQREPLVYAAFFGCIAGCLACLLAAAFDLFHPFPPNRRRAPKKTTAV